MLKLTDKKRRKYLQEYRSRPEVKEQERKFRKESIIFQIPTFLKI